MKAVKLHHPLADIQIKPLAVHHAVALKEFIRRALDEYVEEETVPLSDLRQRMQKRHGDAYQTVGYYLKLYRTRVNLTQVELSQKMAVILECDYRKFL